MATVTLKPLEEQVLQILNKHDPLKIIAMGAPLDEYIDEARDLTNLIGTAKDQEAMHMSVYTVFVSYFGVQMAGARKDYQKISEELYAIQEI